MVSLCLIPDNNPKHKCRHAVFQHKITKVDNSIQFMDSIGFIYLWSPKYWYIMSRCIQSHKCTIYIHLRPESGTVAAQARIKTYFKNNDNIILLNCTVSKECYRLYSTHLLHNISHLGTSCVHQTQHMGWLGCQQRNLKLTTWFFVLTCFRLHSQSVPSGARENATYTNIQATIFTFTIYQACCICFLHLDESKYTTGMSHGVLVHNKGSGLVCDF